MTQLTPRLEELKQEILNNPSEDTLEELIERFNELYFRTYGIEI